VYYQPAAQPALCLFEYIYFARPDSIIQGRLVHVVRTALGRELAREAPVDADVVIGVPDSATPAAIGYAKESGVPYGEGLIKNGYVGRTFIQPDQAQREQGVRLKLNPLRDVLQGQRVVLVDDSIVRGTTSRGIIGLLRQAGAREIHLRICSPPIKHPCFMGVDIGAYHELIAHRLTVQELSAHVGADSLAYLSYDGLLRAAGGGGRGFCGACFTGAYPVPIDKVHEKKALEMRAVSNGATRSSHTG
jgi:amidophosphoribosyltransferase